MYKSYFKESETEADLFAKEIKDAIGKIFPNFGVFTYYKNDLLPSITVSVRIGKDKSEWSGGIAGNDALSSLLSIKGINDDGSLTDSMEMTNLQSSVMTKPENEMFVYGSVKIPFRKVKGDKKKILQAIVKYYQNVKSVLKDVKNKNLNHPHHDNLFKKVK
jgi:hypothetical protein